VDPTKTISWRPVLVVEEAGVIINFQIFGGKNIYFQKLPAPPFFFCTTPILILIQRNKYSEP
jgi:hypothetical protein